ncbi:MAG: polyprenyl synthetase family protein [Deltaproteobacteria bacterium]|jgi:octaprenyl-diphosphate synthase|nr:polyprenyl synthetase family protein [Deltaproteobacteria bacterium]MBW2500276.1 polyprenyl synthetase family protein [Deltaproteobacteria bacterium]
MSAPPPDSSPDVPQSGSQAALSTSTSNLSNLSDNIAHGFARIAPDLQLVETSMRDQIGSKAELVGLLGSHVLSSGGKRLRPALVLLAAELCGYTGPRRIELAAALELLHTATLVHDDIVDLAEMRRGRPAASAIWGNRRAVLAGDFFYARSSSIIVQDGNLEIVESFARTIASMAEGELLQLERSFDVDVTESHYYDVIDRKSAALLSNCCEIGAHLGGVTRGERNRIREYGRQLGLAFQLRDDCLDYESELADLGKQPMADLREGKITLPLILTLKRCRVGERELVARVLKSAARLADEHGGMAPSESPELELGSVVEMVTRYHGLRDTRRRAEEHVARALEAIAPFAEGPAKQALCAAAEFSVARDR